MRQYTIHLPVKYNDGTLVPLERIDRIMEDALAFFGGYSYDPTRIMGAWKDETTGKNYIEDMTRLVLATDNPSLLITFVKGLASKLDQEAMYMVDNGNVSFIK